MELDNTLEALESVGQPRGFENYYLTFFGAPSTTAPWAWRFQGHHISLSVTLAAGDISVTPSFLGAAPAEIPTGFKAGLRALRAEEDLGRELVRSFDKAQRDLAIISNQAPRDIFSGNLNAEEFRLKDRGDWDAWRETGIIFTRFGTASPAILATTYWRNIGACHTAEKQLARRFVDQFFAVAQSTGYSRGNQRSTTSSGKPRRTGARGPWDTNKPFVIDVQLHATQGKRCADPTFLLVSQ